MDNFLTKDIQDWLSLTDRSDDDIRKGAMLLLRLNRNRSLYQSIVLRPKRLEDTLVHELKKHLKIRLAGMTLQDVEKQSKELYTEIESAMKTEPTDNGESTVQSLPAHGGKRADHDSLPENIRNLWDESAQRWKKIKEMYNTCLSIEQPCDRAELLNVLKEAWYKYKKDLQQYDAFVINTNANADAASDTPVSASQLAKALGNAKAYISKSLKDDRLQKMREASMAANASDKDKEAYESLRQKVQDRVDLILENHDVIGDDIRKKLKAGGINV